jgi:hypothetical protein
MGMVSTGHRNNELKELGSDLGFHLEYPWFRRKQFIKAFKVKHNNRS